MSEPVRELPEPGRRRLLHLLVGAVAATLGSCSAGGGGSADADLRVPLAEIPPGGRQRYLIGDLPVEIARSEGGVTARSLLCTHFGCEVAWQPAEGVYQCPCHDGRFDSSGAVLFGPPPEPLRSLPAEVKGGEVVVRLPESTDRG